MKCPYCQSDKDTIKAGVRSTSKGRIQKYYCRDCRRYFSDIKRPKTQYPEHVILYTLEQYNRGYPVTEAKKRTGRRYRYSPPRSTVYSWIDRYKHVLTFLKLRKKYDIDPARLVVTRNLRHRQVYPFTYHRLKLNIHSKRLPQLKRYINWIERSLPGKMFLSGPRCSHTATNRDSKVRKRNNIAPKLARLALNNRQKSTTPHEAVESFFLYNDSTTVAAELPVFLNPEETDLDVDAPITGHIDLVQIRYDTLYILDYKPNLNRPKDHASQLQLYRDAVQKRTSVPKDRIKIAVFNSYDYYELE